MKSEATTVDEYLAEAPVERRPALETLRGLCLDELTGYDEGMQYGMPSYSRDGTVESASADGERVPRLGSCRSPRVGESHRAAAIRWAFHGEV